MVSFLKIISVKLRVVEKIEGFISPAKFKIESIALNKKKNSVDSARANVVRGSQAQARCVASLLPALARLFGQLTHPRSCPGLGGPEEGRRRRAQAGV